MSTDRAEKQPKLPDKSERLKTLIDYHVPTKALSSSSADEHIETFEVAASDNGCNSRLSSPIVIRCTLKTIRKLAGFLVFSTRLTIRKMLFMVKFFA
jgi:hypothetical protein